MGSRSKTFVDDVCVRRGLDLSTDWIPPGQTQPTEDKIFTVADLVDGLLVDPPPNVLFDLEGAIRVIKGVRYTRPDGSPMGPTLPPPVRGPITIAAFTTAGVPALLALQFSHLDQSPEVNDTERFSGSHGLTVSIDAYMRPIQVFYRSSLDGGKGAWCVPDWGA